MWCLWQERDTQSLEDFENGLLEIKKMMLQSLFTWKMAGNSVHVSNCSEFLELMCFFFYNFGVLLHTSYVVGVRPSAL
jgi:hypothetical protein